VEEDDITDIYYHDGLGIPMFGDRSSWRDYDADDDGTVAATPLSYYHAEDIRDEQPQRHNPWPATSGQAPVSDGSKWVPTDIITQAEFDYSFYISTGHCPVTLDADAALILDLQGGCTPAQEIGLDVQQATHVFMGPSFMPPDEPTFRPMYIEELANVTTTAPIIDGEVLTYDGVSGVWVNDAAATPIDTGDLHGHIINEDHSAECNDVETGFSTSFNFLVTTTAVYLNGLRQRLGTHYTEDAGLDGITMITPPETDDELIIDYIVSYADWLIIITPVVPPPAGACADILYLQTIGLDLDSSECSIIPDVQVFD
jgi:hypothetical protein